MRRKLAYSTPVLTNSTAKLGSLPQGDWHVSKTGGKLFVGDTNWTRYATLGETVNEAEFRLDKTTSMLVQAQDKTTCRDIAIESKPAYDIYVVGGGASELLHRADRTILAPSRLVVGDDRAEYGENHQDHRIERQFIPRHRGRADLHGDRGQSVLAVVGQYRPSDDGWRHMLGCPRGCAGACEADEQQCHVQRRCGNHEERHAPVEQGIAHGRRCEGPAHMPRTLLGRRLDCPPGGRRQLLRQGYGNLLALSLGVAA